MGLSPTESWRLGAGVSSSHHPVGSRGWELVHATLALSGWESACRMLALSHCPLLSLPGCHTEPIPSVWPPPSQPSRSPVLRVRVRDTQPQLALLKGTLPAAGTGMSWHCDYVNEFILNICSAEDEMPLNKHVPHPHRPLPPFPGAASGLQISPCLSQCRCLPVSLPPTQHVLSLDPALTALLALPCGCILQWLGLPQP